MSALWLSLALASFPVPGPRAPAQGPSSWATSPGINFGSAFVLASRSMAPPSDGAPGGSEPGPEGTPTQPGTGEPRPDGVTGEPGTGEPGPDGAPTELGPDGVTAEPGTTAEPGGTEPGATAEPGGATTATGPDGGSTTDTKTDGTSTEAGEGGEPSGPTSLDDIFGTSDDHTDVVVISEEGGDPPEPNADGTTPTPTRPAAGARRPLIAPEKLKTQVRIVSSAYYDTARVDQRGFGRNENRLEFYFAYTPNDHLQIVGDVEPVFFGVAQAQELDDLATQQMLTPFHLESDAAYIALTDLLPNLDIKIGRQTLVWGAADKFNPTNNINADDLEDRPLFTEPIGNQMIVADYAPLADKLWFQGVYVPIFYPALLPPSAAIALKDPQAPVPYALDTDLAKIGELQNLLAISPRLVPEVRTTVKVPRARFTNGQSAIKLGTSLGGVDMTFSYFNGRHDIPTPILAQSDVKNPQVGMDAECCYTSDVTLIYPRMQVVGADFTTQLGFLGDMGLWGEGALFFPQAQDFRIEFPIAIDVTPDDGMANPVRDMEGPTIRSNPFIKATAGLDYSFGKHVYVQAQYLRGFIDEFGVDHIGNYVVGGADLIFFGRHLIFRMFGVADIPTGRGDNGSYVLYPDLILVPPWGSVTFELGSFFLLGERDTKFGQPGAGSSIAFFKVAGTF